MLQNAHQFGEVEGGLKVWLERVVAEQAPGASSLAIRFVDDSEMSLFNLRYRGRAASTDVLTFPGEMTPEGHHLGDILISVPTARRQAEEQGHDVLSEVRMLILHGILHCLGMDHETDEGEMERSEESLRQRWLGDV